MLLGPPVDPKQSRTNNCAFDGSVGFRPGEYGSDQARYVGCRVRSFNQGGNSVCSSANTLRAGSSRMSLSHW